ncbi:hypothetical protein [uncultured Alistipes sp.]|uniref:hypothetical protein n=1 Tax=uncultured Alistipes sp. TaxID=538949 RepID=UPI00320933F7
MCFIEFLNEYTGAFTVLLTLILVIINIYMGWQNYVLRKDSIRPKVLAEVYRDKLECIVHYKFINYGASSAVNLRIKIDPYLIEKAHQSVPLSRNMKQIENGFFSLSPGEEFGLSTETRWAETRNRKISLSYTYEDLSGNSYSEKYLFDLSTLYLKLTPNKAEKWASGKHTGWGRSAMFEMGHMILPNKV